MEAELRAPGMAPVRSAFGFRVAEELLTGRSRPMLPDYLAERIVLRQSLRPDAEGVRFTLRNLTRPAVLTGIRELRLDGRPMDGARVLVQTESGRLPLPRRLDLPGGREMGLLVEGSELGPGAHELELDPTLPGVARGRGRGTG